jgi:hypothetical protein
MMPKPWSFRGPLQRLNEIFEARPRSLVFPELLKAFAKLASRSGRFRKLEHIPLDLNRGFS